MPSPSMVHSSTRNAWYSSTSRTHISTDAPLRIARVIEARWRGEGFDRGLKIASAQAILVHRHSHCGIHSYFAQRGDLALRLDAAGGDDGVRGGAAQLSKPIEVCAGHGAFAVHVRAEESRAEWLELRHYVFGLEGQALAPSLNRDLFPGSVQRNDDLLARYFFGELPEKAQIRPAIVKGCAP